jgi:hypothetical protein
MWSHSFGNEIRHLANTTETIFFINKIEIPQEHKGGVIFGRIVCVYREGKHDKYHTQITMGGSLIKNYPSNCGSPNTDLLRGKLLLNSIIFTPKEKFMSINRKDFYLCRPMSQYKYLGIKLEIIPK